MAIINGARFSKKSKVKININSELLEQIQNYCKWSGVEDISYFIEEAAYFVFSKDKDWKDQNKTKKRASRKSKEVSE